MSTVLLFVLFICILSFFLRKTLFPQKKGNAPPGPAGLPIIGNLFSAVQNLPRKLATWSKIYGRTVSIQLGGKFMVVIHDPDLAKTVLSDENTTGRDPNFIFGDYFKGKGISLSEGELWKEQRRFALSTLRNLGMGKSCLEDAVLDEVAGAITTFQNSSSAAFNPCPHLTLSVSNIICALVFGKRFDHSNKKFIRLCGLFRENFHLMGELIPVGIYPFLRHLPFGKFRKLVKLYFDNIADVKSFCRDLIEEHKAKHSNDLEREEEKSDYIDRFLVEQKKQVVKHGNQKPFEDDQLLYTVINLFSAGTETTTSSLLWSFVFMAQYPDIQRKVQEEIDTNIGRDRPIRLSDKVLLKYTEAVLLDVQRLATVAPLGATHTNLQAMKIDGFDIPARSTINVNIFGIHHDASLWEKPFDLYPEHFLDATGTIFIPKGFMPFGIGKRACAGESLARMELYLFFANILQKFKIEGNAKPLPSIINTPISLLSSPPPYNIRFTPRE